MKYVSGPDGTWIPAGRRTQAAERSGPYVRGDLEDYRPVAGPEAERFIRRDKDARMISGRKQHREYLNRNGLQEVGNEWKAMTQYGGKTADNPTRDWAKYGTSGKWSAPDIERLMRGRK